MTGAEHYREAEEALAVLNEEREPDAWAEALKSGELTTVLQAGQIHATLALAAATMQQHNRTDSVTGAWLDVLS